MAFAGRSDRRRRSATGVRWVTIGLVVTLFVLLIDASLHSRTPAKVSDVSGGAWIDRVLPVIESSTAEGQVVSSLWSAGLHDSAGVLTGQVDHLASEAQTNYQTVLRLHPPQELAGSAGLLEAALLARSQAATLIKAVFTSTLGAAATEAASAPPATSPTTTAGSRSRSSATSTTSTTVVPLPSTPDAEISQVSTAGSDISVGDNAYRLFQSTFPASFGVRMPASEWASDLGPYQPSAARAYLDSLQSAVVTSPVHQLRIYAVTTSPAPVNNNGGVVVIPPASAITLTIVVADTGNQAESNLTVTASLSPSGTGASSARDFVNLKAGQSYTISGLGPLSPLRGTPVTLTVTLSAPASSPAAPASYTLQLEMPAPAPPSTTSTTTPSKSTAPTS